MIFIHKVIFHSYVSICCLKIHLLNFSSHIFYDQNSQGQKADRINIFAGYVHIQSFDAMQKYFNDPKNTIVEIILEDWCGACQQFKPIWESTTKKYISNLKTGF